MYRIKKFIVRRARDSGVSALLINGWQRHFSVWIDRNQNAFICFYDNGCYASFKFDRNGKLIDHFENGNGKEQCIGLRNLSSEEKSFLISVDLLLTDGGNHMK